MPFKLTMPKLSPTMEEGTIAKWHKKEGDFVKAGELLLEVATDKATVEHSALDDGWLRKILVAEGGEATVNQPIAIFSLSEDESIEVLDTSFVPEKKMAEEQKKESVCHDEKKLPPQEKSGFALSQPAFTPEPPLELKRWREAKEGRLHASPLARKLAKEKGLDLSTVLGTGPGGRIISKDLDHAQPAGLVTFGRHESPEVAPGSFEELPLSPIRKTIARRLQESKTFIPHFYVKQTIDAEPLLVLKEQLKTYRLKVTFNDFIIKGCALALREHPEVNSGFNSVNQTIISFKSIDISVAVTIEAGLITPILRHADFKNLGQISTEMRQLAERAKKGKLTNQEYKGGSFCISNLGMFGITEFTAVINPPQSAILAVGGVEEKPVVKNGAVVPGKSLVLTLSADHRVIDGALGAQFMKTLQRILENPVALTL